MTCDKCPDYTYCVTTFAMKLDYGGITKFCALNHAERYAEMERNARAKVVSVGGCG